MNRSALKAMGMGALLALAAAGVAQAHAHLLSSAPAPDSIAPAPSQIRLAFSERLEPKFSGFEVDGADGKKAVVAVSTDPSDPQVLIGTPKAPLSAGMYRVVWWAVSADSHRMTGAFAFTVR
ncbi:MAG: copper homeostasis periplasmic binding protein CopC [Caulobacteraceae bacterium]|nr:copper homeostasis periplasmic binding protein CopC [Caulobacteraceae bacterium]